MFYSKKKKKKRNLTKSKKTNADESRVGKFEIPDKSGSIVVQDHDKKNNPGGRLADNQMANKESDENPKKMSGLPSIDKLHVLSLQDQKQAPLKDRIFSSPEQFTSIYACRDTVHAIDGTKSVTISVTAQAKRHVPSEQSPSSEYNNSRSEPDKSGLTQENRDGLSVRANVVGKPQIQFQTKENQQISNSNLKPIIIKPKLLTPNKTQNAQTPTLQLISRKTETQNESNQSKQTKTQVPISSSKNNLLTTAATHDLKNNANNLITGFTNKLPYSNSITARDLLFGNIKLQNNNIKPNINELFFGNIEPQNNNINPNLNAGNPAKATPKLMSKPHNEPINQVSTITNLKQVNPPTIQLKSKPADNLPVCEESAIQNGAKSSKTGDSFYETCKN